MLLSISRNLKQMPAELHFLWVITKIITLKIGDIYNNLVFFSLHNSFEQIFVFFDLQEHGFTLTLWLKARIYLLRCKSLCLLKPRLKIQVRGKRQQKEQEKHKPNTQILNHELACECNQQSQAFESKNNPSKVLDNLRTIDDTART